MPVNFLANARGRAEAFRQGPGWPVGVFAQFTTTIHDAGGFVFRRIFVVPLLLFAFTSALLATPAQAAKGAEGPSSDPVAITVACSGSGCDNDDPYDSGCAASGINVASRATSKGTFYLRYSTVCKTNWIYVPNYSGGSTRTDRRLELTVWDVPRNVLVRFWASPTAGVHYGNMVYSPGSNCAWGFADWTGGDWDVRIPSSGC